MVSTPGWSFDVDAIKLRMVPEKFVDPTPSITAFQQRERDEKESRLRSLEDAAIPAVRAQGHVYLLPGVDFINCSIAWSIVKLAGFWRGGNSMNEITILPTIL